VRKETVATLDAKADAQGHLESVPVKLLVQDGGYKFATGDVLKISATYDIRPETLAQWAMESRLAIS